LSICRRKKTLKLCLPAIKAGLNFIRLATPTTDDKRLPAVLANTSGFVYYVSVTGITGSASADSQSGSARRSPASSGTRNCRSVSASASAPRKLRALIAANADGAVVGTALVDALRASLDPNGGATAKNRRCSADLAASLAQGVRGAKQAAE